MSKVDIAETLARAKGRENAGYEHPGHYNKMKEHLKSMHDINHKMHRTLQKEGIKEHEHPYWEGKK
jgi:phenylalanyl-tRNA synthetase beta subunit